MTARQRAAELLPLLSPADLDKAVGLVAVVIETAEQEVRNRVVALIKKRADDARGYAWFHPEHSLASLAEEILEKT